MRAAVVAVVLFAVAFTANFAWIYNHFYHDGAFYLDAGMFAAILWRSGPECELPAASYGGTFFRVHFAPLLSVFSMLSAWIPAGHVATFGAYLGCAFGGLALSVYLPLQRWYCSAPRAAGLALLFAWNGLALNIAADPHIEVMAPGLLLLFVYFCFRGRWLCAGVFFVLACMVREDVGLHGAALLGVLLGYRLRGGATLRELWPLAAFLLIGLIYGLGAWAYVRGLSAGDDAFRRVYSGHPPWAHVDFSLLQARLTYYLLYRTYLWVPFAALVLFAWRSRCGAWLLGFGACLPWLALHFVAYSHSAGSLDSYYAYPLLVAFAWPLYGGLCGDKAATLRLLLAMMVLSQFAMLAQGANGLRRFALWWPRPGLHQREAVDGFLSTLRGARSSTGVLRVDGAILSLDPRGFEKGEWIELPGPEQPDTVVFWKGHPDAALASEFANRVAQPKYFRLPGTPIVAVSSRSNPSPGLAQSARVHVLVEGTQSSGGIVLGRSRALQKPAVPGPYCAYFLLRSAGPNSAPVRLSAEGAGGEVAAREVSVGTGAAWHTLEFSTSAPYEDIAVRAEAGGALLLDYKFAAEAEKTRQ